MLRINLKLYSVMANSVTKTLVVAAMSATATAASAGAMAFAANAATSPITTTTDGNGLIRGDLVTGVTSIKGLDDLKGLTEEQVKALRIVDNKSNESPWDFDFLADELADLDLSNFDFDFGIDTDAEKSNVNIDDFFVDAEQKPKEPKKIQCPHCGEWFEI